jgi:hypothetical protein
MVDRLTAMELRSAGWDLRRPGRRAGDLGCTGPCQLLQGVDPRWRSPAEVGAVYPGKAVG